MPRFEPKPSAPYHMGVCRYARDGWRKTKDGTYHGERGTFLAHGARVVFIGWSGRIVSVE